MSKLPPARARTRNASAVKAAQPGTGRVGPGTTLTFSAAGEEVLKSASTQQIADPFDNNYLTTNEGELSVQQPPYNFAVLNKLPLENSMLRQCIEAMVTNCEGHGWRLEYVGPEGQEESAGAVTERKRMEALLLAPNPDMTLDDIRERCRRDRETLGIAYMEVGRDAKGEVCMVAHVPGSSLRMTYKETTYVTVDVPVPGTDGEQIVKMPKRFRRYVQRVGNNLVYFKEFGDPRRISSKTGRVDASCPEEETATEIIAMPLYSPGTAYGVPRWINQVPSILGSRQAELTNLDFFRENAIPAMVVTVAGGRLTETSLHEIEQHLSGVRGRQSMNRVVVLEALGDSDAGDDKGAIPPPKIEIKPMAGERQKDGYFLDYLRECAKAIRSAFRLPPIFVGQSEDYSHATAKASYEVAESQVFGPERRYTDGVWNSKILRGVGGNFWELRSNPPRISDPEEVIQALQAFSSMGALTPNQAIDLANEYFDLELDRITEEWGDLPYSMVSALLTTGRMKGLDRWLEAPEGVPDALANPDVPTEESEDEEEESPVVKATKAINAARYAIVSAATAALAEKANGRSILPLPTEEAAPETVEVRV